MEYEWWPFLDTWCCIHKGRIVEWGHWPEEDWDWETPLPEESEEESAADEDLPVTDFVRMPTAEREALIDALVEAHELPDAEAEAEAVPAAVPEAEAEAATPADSDSESPEGTAAQEAESRDASSERQA